MTAPASSRYRYHAVRKLHLELTSRCQVACPMCARNLSGGRTRDNIRETEIVLGDVARWFDDSFLARLSSVLLCGNFGDPIVARDCLPIVEHIRARNPAARIAMNTNGSARPPEFWTRLAALGVRVTFAIDGATEASHARYRRGASLARVLGNARIFSDAGGASACDMLLFAHNDGEVAEVRRLARAAGIRRMTVKATNRFAGPEHPVLDGEGRAVDVLHPSREAARGPALPGTPFGLRTGPIACRSEAELSVYVSAEGYVFPCCWLAQLLPERPFAPDSLYARKFPGRQRNPRLDTFFAAVDAIGLPNLDLRRRSLERIVDRALPAFAAFREADAARIDTCATTCGRTDEDPIGAMRADAFDLAADPA